MRIKATNRRRSTLTDRDVENKVIQAVLLLGIIFFCTSLMLTTIADIACAPAARSVLATTSHHPPYNSQTAAASEQAGELAAYYREMF